jgi:hypothetical protein
VKGLAFRIHGFAEKLENLPVVKQADRHIDFDDSDNDGSDGRHGGGDVSEGSHGGDDCGTPTVATD